MRLELSSCIAMIIQVNHHKKYKIINIIKFKLMQVPYRISIILKMLHVAF
jgi:hypothetical protein